MVLSERLMMSIGMIPTGKVVADVGCDHARVAIWLVKNGIAPRVIATDLRPGPLSHADANIAYFHCEDRIETRLSDGLENLRPSEAEVILIAGMGGALTVHILSEGLERMQEAEELILQPQSERGAVRRFLLTHGFAITEESCCIEDGKFYNSIHAVNRKKVSVKPLQSLTESEPTTDGDEEASEIAGTEGKIAGYEPAELEFGKLLLQERNPVLREYLKNEYRKALIVKENLESNDTESARERLPGFMEELKVLECALEFYSGQDAKESFEKRRVCGEMLERQG